MYRSSEDWQSQISAALRLLLVVRDSDDRVAKLAQQVLKEIWLQNAVADSETHLDTLGAMAAILHQSPETEHALIHFIRQAIYDSSDTFRAFENCKCLVTAALESMTNCNNQASMLQCLLLFGKANVSLFASEELALLEPLVSNVEEETFGQVLILCRLILEQVQEFERPLLLRVQGSLLDSVINIRKSDFDRFAACLWAISARAKNTTQIVDLLCDFATKLNDLMCVDLSDPNQRRSLAKTRVYVHLVGSLGRYCDLQCQQQATEELSFSSKHWEAGLTVRVLLSFVEER